MLTQLISARNDSKIAILTTIPKIETSTMTKDFKQQSAAGSAFGSFARDFLGAALF